MISSLIRGLFKNALFWIKKQKLHKCFIPAKPAFVPNCQPTQKKSVNDHTLRSPLATPSFLTVVEDIHKTRPSVFRQWKYNISAFSYFEQLLRKSVEKSCLLISEMGNSSFRIYSSPNYFRLHYFLNFSTIQDLNTRFFLKYRTELAF